MKPLSKQTHYEVLEVAPTAPVEVIDSAWHKLRRLLGPGSIATYSLVDPAEQQALLLRLDEARTVLTDPVARRAYDHSLGLAVPVEADTASVGIETIGEMADDDESDILELEDGDVLEIFDATPGPIFVESTVQGFGTSPSEDEEAGTVPVIRESQSTSLVTLSESSRSASARSAHGGELEPAPGGEAEPIEPESAAIPEITLDTEFTGSLLRELREASGLSLEVFAGRTRINLQHLLHVEGEVWSSLPERVFLRGILGNYARELRLDATRVCNSYLARRPG